MHILEIFALTMMIFVIFKFVIFGLNPKRDKKALKKISKKVKTIKIVSLILAFMVLYLLINAGLTIVDVFAVSLFLALLVVVGLADYLDVFIKKIKTKDLLKKGLLYVLAWLFLIGWLIKAIFF